MIRQRISQWATRLEPSSMSAGLRSLNGAVLARLIRSQSGHNLASTRENFGGQQPHYLEMGDYSLRGRRKLMPRSTRLFGSLGDPTRPTAIGGVSAVFINLESDTNLACGEFGVSVSVVEVIDIKSVRVLPIGMAGDR